MFFFLLLRRQRAVLGRFSSCTNSPFYWGSSFLAKQVLISGEGATSAIQLFQFLEVKVRTRKKMREINHQPHPPFLSQLFSDHANFAFSTPLEESCYP